MIRFLQDHSANFVGIHNYKLVPAGTVISTTTFYDTTKGNTVDSNSDFILNATIFKFVRVHINITAITGTWTPAFYTLARKIQAGWADQSIKSGPGITVAGQTVLTLNLYMENFVLNDELRFYMFMTVAGSLTFGAEATLYT